jgi:hypothetical protein
MAFMVSSPRSKPHSIALPHRRLRELYNNRTIHRLGRGLFLLGNTAVGSQRFSIASTRSSPANGDSSSSSNGTTRLDALRRSSGQSRGRN